MKSSEEAKREALQALYDFLEPIRQLSPQNTTLQSLMQNAEAALAASEKSDLDWLHSEIKVLMQSEEKSSQYHEQQGDSQAARDCAMRAEGLGRALDVIEAE